MNAVELLSTKGQSMVCIDNFCYSKKKSSAISIRWQCSKQRNGGCKGGVTTDVNRQNPRSFTTTHVWMTAKSKIAITKSFARKQ